jgi:hypothetical protein
MTAGWRTRRGQRIIVEQSGGSLEWVLSNPHRQRYGSQQPDGYDVNGSMSLQITLT